MPMSLFGSADVICSDRYFSDCFCCSGSADSVCCYCCSDCFCYSDSADSVCSVCYP